SAPLAWVSGTTYHAGDKVSFSGHDYKAKTGITAVAAPAWVSGTAYVTGNEVSFGGQNYIAKDNTVNVTVDPATNTSEWLVDDATTDPAHNSAQWFVDDGEYATNNRLSGDMGGAGSSISSAAPTGNVASDALSSSPPAGTSAEIFGAVLALGGVHV